MNNKQLYPKVILKTNTASSYFILNRPVDLVYKEVKRNNGRFLIGNDGAFYDILHYNQDPFARAFGGRTLTLKMHDGELRQVKDVWWYVSALFAGVDAVGVAAASIKQLQKCFVFCGYMVATDIYNKWVEDKSIPRYEYRRFSEALRRVSKRREGSQCNTTR